MLIARINKDWKFPNGVYIFGADGKQIDPASEEGKIIISIYEIQAEVKKQNKEQKERWITDTFPRDPKKQAEYRKKFGLE